MNPSLKNIAISIKSGLRIYQSLYGTIGLIIGVLSLGNLVISFCDISIIDIFHRLILIYKAIVYPIPKFIGKLFSINIPEVAIDISVLYCLIGASIARVQKSYFETNPHKLQIEVPPDRYLGRRDECLTWLAYKILLAPRWALEKSNLSTQNVDIYYRLYMTYRFLPSSAKYFLDLFVWPFISFPKYFSSPIEVYQDNGNNPEDNGVYRVETSVPINEPVLWIRFDFQRDLRVVLVAQILLIVCLTSILLLMNGIIVEVLKY